MNPPECLRRFIYLSNITATSAEGQGQEEGSQRRTPLKRIRHPEKHTLVSNTEPRRRGRASRLPGLPAQLSNIVPILQTSELGEGGTTTTTLTFLQPPRTLSTGLGEDQDSAAGRAILAYDQPTEENPILNHSFLNHSFLSLRLALKFLPSTVRVQEIPVNNPLGSEGRFNNWLKSGSERVGCLVIQLETERDFFYRLEKELVSKQYGPLILANQQPTGEQATEAELSSLMDTRTLSRIWPLTVPGWTLKHIRHSYGSPEGMAAGVLRAVEMLSTTETPRAAAQLPTTPTRP